MDTIKYIESYLFKNFQILQKMFDKIDQRLSNIFDVESISLYTSTGLFLKNTNINNFSNNNTEIKMKVNTNPNIANNKTKISSYNNIPKNKKELVTIRNTVINFNMVNSSLIISSLNK